MGHTNINCDITPAWIALHFRHFAEHDYFQFAGERWRHEVAVAALAVSGRLMKPLWTYYNAAEDAFTLTAQLTSAGLYNITVGQNYQFENGKWQNIHLTVMTVSGCIVLFRNCLDILATLSASSLTMTILAVGRVGKT